MIEPWRRVTSDDGQVALAVHSLAGTAERPTLLMSHATGFHAHCYSEIADELANDWHVIGIDHRGHGYTAPDPNDPAHVDPNPNVDWAWFGDDIVTLARAIAPTKRTPPDSNHPESNHPENSHPKIHQGDGLIAFGHSMGAAALILAAAAEPDLFAQLVLYEPIAPSGFVPAAGGAAGDADADLADNRLAMGARRRRRTFPSTEDAIANYGAKPPLSAMTPTALEQYVLHGFAPSPDGITLRCTPEYEAATFESAITNGVWEALDKVTTPSIVVTGKIEADQPSAWAPPIADRMPNAKLLVFDSHTHFGPFTHPQDIAALFE